MGNITTLQRHSLNSLVDNNDYISGVHYENGVLKFVNTSVGRVVRNGATNYSYEYTLTDHLGNGRVYFDIVAGAAHKIQETDYYGFGLEIERQVPSPRNMYMYNGKEKQNQEKMLDYGARFYDPVIGRWSTIDPLAEVDRMMSPYVYVLNNPMRFIDPDGMMPFADYYDANGLYLGDDGVDDDKVYILNYGKAANLKNKAVNWGGRLSTRHANELKSNSQEAEMPGLIGYSIDEGENASSDKYNKYDKEIAVATHLLNREIKKGSLSVGDGYSKGTNATELDVNLVKALAYKESRLGQGQSVATNASDIFSMFHIGDYGDKYKMGMTLNDVKNGSGPLKSTYWGVRWLHFKSYMSEDGKVKNFQGWNYGVQKYGPGKKEPNYLETVLKIYKSIE